MIYKLHLHLTDSVGVFRWEPFYMDVSRIYAWYLPSKDSNDKVGPAVIVFAPGDSFYLKQEPHLLEYLKKHVYVEDPVRENS